MYRSNSFNERLSKELKDPEYRKGFLLSLLEDDDISLEQALKATISSMGVKEFSKLSKIPSPNIVQFIKGKRKIKLETLDTYLRPFGLKAKVIAEEAS